jgi:hypothetical protein
MVAYGTNGTRTGVRTEVRFGEEGGVWECVCVRGGGVRWGGVLEYRGRWWAKFWSPTRVGRQPGSGDRKRARQPPHAFTFRHSLCG